MKPPRSVWVVVSPNYGPVEAYPINQKPDDDAGWNGAVVVRYVLPPKRKPAKGNRRAT